MTDLREAGPYEDRGDQPIGRVIVACWVLGFLLGCQSPSDRGDQVESVLVPSFDGVALAFEERGEGDVTVVLIHGWCCNRRFWNGSIEALAERYRVVALDLGGHGESGANREAWSIPVLARDVEAVVEHVVPEGQIVLVGHSMGGPVALGAVPLLDGRVVGVVAIDTLHDVEMVPPPEMISTLVESYEGDFEGTMTEAVRSMFPADFEPAVVDRVIRQACTTDHRAAVALLESYSTLDLPGLLKRAGVPVHCINAQPPRAPETRLESNRQYGSLSVELMEGTGHYPMIEVPERFIPRLLAVLASLSGEK
ncbi:MAG: alpha/beta hydrolase [Planctomycetota bacterium]